MRMKVTREMVFEVCERFTREGRKLNANAIYNEVKVGTGRTIQQHLDAWREQKQREAAAPLEPEPVAVPERIREQIEKSEGEVVAAVRAAEERIYATAQGMAEERIQAALKGFAEREEIRAEELQSLRDMDESKEAQLETKEEEIAVLQEELARIVAEAKAAHETHLGEVGRLKGAIADRDRDLAVAQKDAQDRLLEVTHLEDQNQALEQRLTTAQENERGARSQLAERDKEVAQVRADLSGSQAEAAAKAAQVADLQTRLDRAESKAQERREREDSLVGENARLKEQLQGLMAEVATAQSDLNTTRDDLVALKVEKGTLGFELSAAKTATEKARQEAADAQKVLADQDHEHRTLKARIAELEKAAKEHGKAGH